MAEHLDRNDLETFQIFMDYMEKNKIDNKDVTSYSSMDEIRGAINLASMKEFNKELENIKNLTNRALNLAGQEILTQEEKASIDVKFPDKQQIDPSQYF